MSKAIFPTVITTDIDNESKTLRFVKSTYQTNDTLATFIEEQDENGYWEAYDRLTVNLDVNGANATNTAYIDTNRISPAIIKVLIDAGVMHPTLQSASNGLVTYPLCMFNEDWIKMLPELK